MVRPLLRKHFDPPREECRRRNATRMRERAPRFEEATGRCWPLLIHATTIVVDDVDALFERAERRYLLLTPTAFLITARRAASSTDLPS
jgi:hypothetical protein